MYLGRISGVSRAYLGPFGRAGVGGEHFHHVVGRVVVLWTRGGAGGAEEREGLLGGGGDRAEIAELTQERGVRSQQQGVRSQQQQPRQRRCRRCRR